MKTFNKAQWIQLFAAVSLSLGVVGCGDIPVEVDQTSEALSRSTVSDHSAKPVQLAPAVLDPAAAFQLVNIDPLQQRNLAATSDPMPANPVPVDGDPAATSDPMPADPQPETRNNK